MVPVMTTMTVLARADIASVIIWSALLIGLLVLGMAWAAKLRRRMKAEDDAPAAPAGFTLSDLRAMHRQGQLTDEEFERAKEKVVLAAKKAAERIPAPATTNGEPAPRPGDAPARDSVDAIRTRRLAREAEERQPPRQPDEADDADPDAPTR
jgi:hypothetical protein